MSPRRSRRGHHALDTLLVAALLVLAVLSSVAWLLVHVLILAGAALIIAGVYHLGRRGRRRTRPGTSSPGPGQGREAGPAAVPVATATVPVPGIVSDWDEAGARQQPSSLQAGSDRDSLLADRRSGARPLRRPS
jgi:hypothetical protein